MSKIDGVNSDELIVNEKGGSQSYTPYAFHLMDAKSMFALARVLEEGARKHAPDNWRKIARKTISIIL